MHNFCISWSDPKNDHDYQLCLKLNPSLCNECLSTAKYCFNTKLKSFQYNICRPFTKVFAFNCQIQFTIVNPLVFTKTSLNGTTPDYCSTTFHVTKLQIQTKITSTVQFQKKSKVWPGVFFSIATVTITNEKNRNKEI